MTRGARRAEATGGFGYILPLRWHAATSRRELAEVTAAYLARVSHWADVVVIDGSAEPIFAEHRTARSRWVASSQRALPTR